MKRAIQAYCDIYVHMSKAQSACSIILHGLSLDRGSDHLDQQTSWETPLDEHQGILKRQLIPCNFKKSDGPATLKRERKML